MATCSLKHTLLFGKGKKKNNTTSNKNTYTIIEEGYAKTIIDCKGQINGRRIAIKYPLVAVTADCIIFSECGKYVRTVIRGPNTEPKIYANTYAIPGGFVGEWEEPEDAAKREYYEETGLDAYNLKLLCINTNPHRDPRQRTYSFVYWSVSSMEQAETNDSAEISKTEWTPVEDLVSGKINMAFDHQKLLCQAVKEYSIYNLKNN